MLADEVNRATPKTQAAMLEAMQERAVTVAGETRPPPPALHGHGHPESAGDGGARTPSPRHSLDRFLLKAVVPFPSADDLIEVIERTTGTSDPAATAVCDGPTLQTMIALTREVPVPDHVVRHAVDLVVASHPDRPEAPEAVRTYVRFGASPRGVQAMILAGKAAAIMDGRPSVAVDDVRANAAPALRHRLVVGYEATADAMTADDLVESLLAAVPEPASGIRGAP